MCRDFSAHDFKDSNSATAIQMIKLTESLSKRPRKNADRLTNLEILMKTNRSHASAPRN